MKCDKEIVNISTYNSWSIVYKMIITNMETLVHDKFIVNRISIKNKIYINTNSNRSLGLEGWVLVETPYFLTKSQSEQA
jgi:hypothetical protein